MEEMEELGEAGVDFSSSFFCSSLSDWGLERLAFAPVRLHFIFRETGAEWYFPVALCMCSLSRLWVGREI